MPTHYDDSWAEYDKYDFERCMSNPHANPSSAAGMFARSLREDAPSYTPPPRAQAENSRPYYGSGDTGTIAMNTGKSGSDADKPNLFLRFLKAVFVFILFLMFLGAIL